MKKTFLKLIEKAKKIELQQRILLKNFYNTNELYEEIIINNSKAFILM